ncbi:uncharacterized protein LOC144713564 [Wolffia australiana]
MGEHVSLHFDHIAKSVVSEALPSTKIWVSSDCASHTLIPATHSDFGKRIMAFDLEEEEESLLQTVECRICQEEDGIKNLDSPCACRGSLKYAHRACLQQWVNEKGDLTCEICHESYKSGSVVPPRIIPDETAIDVGPFDLHDPRLLAMTSAQRLFLEAEFDEYAARNVSGVSFCRSAALILIALLLLRHAVFINDSEGEDDASTLFFVFLLRAASFLLPCYIMAWAINILQRVRERQEAPELTFILPRGRHLAFSAEQSTNPQRGPRHV